MKKKNHNENGIEENKEYNEKNSNIENTKLNKVKKVENIEENLIEEDEEQYFEKKINFELKGEEMNLEITYDDENLSIINKEKGIIVHPVNEKNSTGTLVNGLIKKFGIENLSNNQSIRPGIVHRIGIQFYYKNKINLLQDY
jgi:23S rRNA-/tRNA-specific pseudouridylate synthase